MSAPKLTVAQRRMLTRIFVHKHADGRTYVSNNLSTANIRPDTTIHQLSSKGLITYEETDEFRIFGVRGWRYRLTAAGEEAMRGAAP